MEGNMTNFVYQSTKRPGEIMEMHVGDDGVWWISGSKHDGSWDMRSQGTLAGVWSASDRDEWASVRGYTR